MISGVLLYTDWDISLAEFIRNNMDEINALVGQQCSIYVIEEPTERWINKNKASLKKELSENFDFLWGRMDWASSKPYDKTEAIEIARHFSIEPGELPSLILFNSGNSNDYLLIRLNSVLPDITDDVEQDYKRFFRKLFSLTSNAAKYPSEVRLIVLEKMIGETWKYRQKRKINQVMVGIAKQISLEVSIVDVIKVVLAAFGKIAP